MRTFELMHQEIDFSDNPIADISAAAVSTAGICVNSARKRMNTSLMSEHVNYSARRSERGRFSTVSTCVSSDFEYILSDESGDLLIVFTSSRKRRRNAE